MEGYTVITKRNKETMNKFYKATKRIYPFLYLIITFAWWWIFMFIFRMLCYFFSEEVSRSVIIVVGIISSIVIYINVEKISLFRDLMTNSMLKNGFFDKFKFEDSRILFESEYRDESLIDSYDNIGNIYETKEFLYLQKIDEINKVMWILEKSSIPNEDIEGLKEYLISRCKGKLIKYS